MDANGDKYVGEWRNDKMNGLGIMYYTNGTVYDGMWEDNMKHGKGLSKGN